MTENRGQRSDSRIQRTEVRDDKLEACDQLFKTRYQKAMNTAVRVLARRDHTRLEIEQKLRQRGYDLEVIRDVVVECERLNYIDDERTAKVYIFQLARRGFGFRRIRLELLKKGLRGDRFDQIVKESRLEIDEHPELGIFSDRPGSIGPGQLEVLHRIPIDLRQGRIPGTALITTVVHPTLCQYTRKSRHTKQDASHGENK